MLTKVSWVFGALVFASFARADASHGVEVGPRVPRLAFACAELLGAVPGSPINKFTVADHLELARARLIRVVEKPRRGRWSGWAPWTDDFNPYRYGALDVSFDHRDQTLRDGNERRGRARAAMADGVLTRLTQIESALDAAARDRSIEAAAARSSTVRLARSIEGRAKVRAFLDATHLGTGRREAAHPGYVETPARAWTADEAARARVGKFARDAFLTAINATGSLGLALVALRGGYDLATMPVTDLGAVIGVIATAATAGGLQSTWAIAGLPNLATSFATYADEVDRRRDNRRRRAYERSVVRRARPFDEIESVFERIERAAADLDHDDDDDAAKARELLRDAVVFQEFRVDLPINAAVGPGRESKITADVIERFERAPDDVDALVTRSLTISLLLINHDDDQPTLQIFVRDAKPRVPIYGYGGWPTEHPYFRM